MNRSIAGSPDRKRVAAACSSAVRSRLRSAGLGAAGRGDGHRLRLAIQKIANDPVVDASMQPKPVATRHLAEQWKCLVYFLVHPATE